MEQRQLPAGYILQAMQMRLQSAQQLDLATVRPVLDALAPETRRMLEDAARVTMNNRSDPGDQALQRLALVARCCSTSWQQQHAAVIAGLAPHLVLATLLHDDGLSSLMEKARQGDPEAMASVQQRMLAKAGRAAPLAHDSASNAADPAPSTRASDPTDHEDAPPPTPAGRRLAALPKARAFSTKAALVLELDHLRDRDAPDEDGRRDGQSTVRVEATRGSREGGYDWARKIAIQLTAAELPGFVATVMGWRAEFKVTNHGSHRNKSMRVANQPQGLYFDLREGEHGVAVPVAAGDQFALAMVCCEALARNHPGPGVAAALDVIRHLEAARHRWQHAEQ